MSKVAVSKVGKKPRSKFNSQANPLLSKLREFLLSDEPRGELPEELRKEGIIADIYRKFEQEYFYSRQGNLEEDSIQKALIETLSNNDPATKQLHANAKRDARGALFDYLVDQGFMDSEGKGNETEDLKTRQHLAELLDDPYLMTTDLSLQEFIADGIANGGSRFLKDLSTMFYNAERREHRLNVDMYVLVIATHWTDSHCPLWLMQVGAILKACKAHSINQSWTMEMVKERLKKLKLKRFRPAPILDIQINKSGKIEVFYINAKVFGTLKSTEFRHEGVILRDQGDAVRSRPWNADDSPELVEAHRLMADAQVRHDEELSNYNRSDALMKSSKLEELLELSYKLNAATSNLRRFEPHKGKETIQWKPCYRALEVGKISDPKLNR